MECLGDAPLPHRTVVCSGRVGRAAEQNVLVDHLMGRGLKNQESLLELRAVRTLHDTEELRISHPKMPRCLPNSQSSPWQRTTAWIVPWPIMANELHVVCNVITARGCWHPTWTSGLPSARWAGGRLLDVTWP